MITPRRRSIRVALAALFALTLGAGPAAPQPPPLRTITIRAVADEAYRSHPGWEAALRATIRTVSEIYERRFQIRLEVVDVVPWTVGGGVPAHDLLHRLVAQVPGTGADVVIGFVRDRCERLLRSQVFPFGTAAVVMTECPITPFHVSPADEGVSHAVAAMLGAFDTKAGTPSVMAHGKADEFDGHTVQVIALMRNRDFARSLLDLDPAIAQRWLAIRADARVTGGNPLAIAIRNAAMEAFGAARVDVAVAGFRRAIELAPDYGRAHADLGLVLARQGQLDEAAKRLRAALRLDFRMGDVRVLLARVLSEQGRVDDAIEELREALRVDYRSTAARVALGQGLIGKRDTAAGLGELHRAVELAPDNVRARAALAWALVEAGRLREAWTQVHEARARGLQVPPAFLDDLARRMPDPGR